MEKNETIKHVVSENSKLAQKRYKTRHDWVGKVIYWELCKKVNFDHATNGYMHKPESVQENEMHPIHFIYLTQLSLFFLFSKLKYHLRVFLYVNNDEVICTVGEFLEGKEITLFCDEISTLEHHWANSIDLEMKEKKIKGGSPKNEKNSRTKTQ